MRFLGLSYSLTILFITISLCFRLRSFSFLTAMIIFGIARIALSTMVIFFADLAVLDRD